MDPESPSTTTEQLSLVRSPALVHTGVVGRNEDAADDCCAICLGTLEGPQPFPNAECPHQFCSECLSQLHQHLEGTAVLCPTCRRPSSLATQRCDTHRFEQAQLELQAQRQNKRVRRCALAALTIAMLVGLAVDHLIHAMHPTEVRSVVSWPVAPATSSRSLGLASCCAGCCLLCTCRRRQLTKRWLLFLAVRQELYV